MSDDENEDVITAVHLLSKTINGFANMGIYNCYQKSTSAQCEIRNVVNSRNKLW